MKPTPAQRLVLREMLAGREIRYRHGFASYSWGQALDTMRGLGWIAADESRSGPLSGTVYTLTPAGRAAAEGK